MIKAVLFDFGGVLSEQGTAGFTGRVLAKLYGVGQQEVRGIVDLHHDFQCGRVSGAVYIDELNRRFDGNVTVKEFLQEADYPTLSEEVYELARSLRGQGVKTAIFSNIPDINARELRQQGCYDGFDPVILSCEEGYIKPDPAFYELAVRRLGVHPEEVLLIDDQERCLPPARQLGMHTILARSSRQIVADTRALIARENGHAPAG